MARNSRLHVRYEENLRVFASGATRVAVTAVIVVAVLLPYQVTDDWLQTLSFCGCFAIGAIGLNLLTGFTGQVSLGHAFFLAVGGYVAAHIGLHSALPVPVWLLLVAIIGAAVGAVIGPFALRLHGNYLAIVTIALLFVSDYIWTRWHWFTGGGVGLQPNPTIRIGPVNFAKLGSIGLHSRAQGVYLLIWIVVAACAVLAKNLVRTRAGRAMQAIRDRDLAAEAIGVSLTRYKVGAFAVSSAMAALAGALYFGVLLRSIEPGQVTGSLGLVLSIQFVAAIIIGGVGTVHGSIVGALFVAGLPELVRRFGTSLPFIGKGKVLSVSAFSNLLFGVLVVGFLLVEPLGFAALWRRVKAYFLTWPFSY